VFELEGGFLVRQRTVDEREAVMTEKRTLAARRGLYFEEFEVGQSITSAGRTVTEADVVGFAALTGDWTAIHADAVYAAQHPLGQRVAHNDARRHNLISPKPRTP
jgi:acyl dehydratase